jgi:hypothetical protein
LLCSLMSKCSSLIEKNSPMILLIYISPRVCDVFVVMVKLPLDLKLHILKPDIIRGRMLLILQNTFINLKFVMI